jgi:hypothetical protein
MLAQRMIGMAAALLALVLAAAPAKASAEIVISVCEGALAVRCGEYVGFINVRGTIAAGDNVRMVEALHAAKAPPGMVAVMLNSTGGDFLESVRMGEWIRRKGFVTAVETGGTCASACVFILAGGVHRFVTSAKVAIHRPYMPARGELPIERVVASMTTTLRKHISDMGLHPELSEDILATEPADLRFLTEAELRRYRLIGSDIVWTENIALKRAEAIGITREELLVRERRMTQSGEIQVCDRERDTEKRTACRFNVAVRYGVLPIVREAQSTR